MRRHLLDQLLGTYGVAGIEYDAAGNRAHQGEIFETHLGGTILADADADVGADQFDISHGNAGDADLIEGAREKTGEG